MSKAVKAVERSKVKALGHIFLICIFAGAVVGQQVRPTANATPAPDTKLSKVLAANLEKVGITGTVSTAQASKAYAKLLEGERYGWAIKNSRTRRDPAMTQATVIAARTALEQAIDANPRLAEAYTALAELAITAPPGDIDEAIDLASLALKIDPKNFGARRILARLFTFKSGLGSRSLEQSSASRAVDEWKFVASLDPRYAEAWAFLSEFYERQDKKTELIEALEKWRSSAAPIDSQFYQRMTGGRASLAPEAATLKLGEALLKSGRLQEAIDTLSVVIADEPENEEAIELLRQAILASQGSDSTKVISALQQAVYSSPDNFALTNLLAEAYARGGKPDEAARVLRDAAAKAAKADPVLASEFYLALGDILDRSGSWSEAKAAYENAISVRRIGDSELSDEQKIFLLQAFEKAIRSAKNAGKGDDALSVIERARKLFGPDDTFADRQLVAFYRESGKRQQALEAVRSQRAKVPHDEGLARQEATILTELGRVDEAVSGYRKHLAGLANVGLTGSSNSEGTSVTIQRPASDAFSNALFISQLYGQAGRGREAVEAANQALLLARGSERRQIAKLSIATAQQMSGDHAAAESTLREILKESPGNPIALNNLGYFLLERDEKLEDALKLIRQALDTDPTNPSYLDSLGWAFYKLGKFGEAEMYLKEALRYDSASSAINEHLGDLYLKVGKPDAAKAQWQRALTLAVDAADIDRLKAKLK